MYEASEADQAQHLNLPLNAKLLDAYRQSSTSLRKSWWVFHDKLLVQRCFWGFVLPVLEYCPAVWCSAADKHLKLLDRVVSGACFLAGGALNCDLSHRWSVAVLCMLYKIRCNPKHPLCGALPVPYVPVPVTRGALIAHQYTFAPPLCRTSQYCRTLFPSQYLSGMIWLTPYLMVWDWLVSRAGPMSFVGLVALSFFLFNYIPFLFFFSIGW